VTGLSCRRANQTVIAAGGRSRDRIGVAGQRGAPPMSDVLFVGLAVAFFALAAAFAWFCEKVR
jgi:hypothetical protein